MAIIDVVRDIDGRKFDDSNVNDKYWTVPLSAWHCHRVISELEPRGFEIDPRLRAFADKDAKQHDLDYPVGLYPFQRDAVDFITHAGGRVILADEMGLGKTIEALAYVSLVSKKTLVISPANVLYKWEAECKKWLPEHSVAVYPTGKGEIGEENIHVMSYGIMTSRYDELKELDYEAIILDEAHLVKNSKAMRTRVVKALVKMGIAHVLFLSGTPFMNRPSELFPMLNMLDPVGFSNYYTYAQRYCNPPEAPIWMGDFSFKPIGEVEVGEEVIGWKKRETPVKLHTKPNKNLREELVRSKVTKVQKRVSEIVKITLKSGNIIRCTPDHLWRTMYSRNSGYEYAPAKIGQSLRKVVTPVDPGSGDSWLSGIYDGEASGFSIAQSKEHNPEVCERIEKELNKHGFSWSFHDNKYNILGGQDEKVRFLNPINPVRRKLSRIDKELLTGMKRELDEVVSIEPDGTGDVISLTTETGNYIVWGYASKNCGAQYVGGAWYFPPNGATNLEELGERVKYLLLRRTKQDVLHDLPDLTRTSIPLEIDNIKDYRKAIKDLRGWLKENKKEVMNPEHILTRLNSLRQIVGNGKVDAAVELAESVLNDGKKVVLFCHHKEVLHRLQEGLKHYRVGVISGDVPPKKRQNLVDDFLKNSNAPLMQDSSLQVMIITVAGAEGIDLFSASDIIFVEREWTPAKEEQAESRLHRNGQKNPVNAWYLVATGTIDEKFDAMVKSKRKMFKQVIRTDEILELIWDDLTNNKGV